MPKKYFMQYWLNPQIDEALGNGALEFAGGNQLGRVNRGDEVWFVTVRPKEALTVLPSLLNIFPALRRFVLFGIGDLAMAREPAKCFR